MVFVFEEKCENNVVFTSESEIKLQKCNKNLNTCEWHYLMMCNVGDHIKRMYRKMYEHNLAPKLH